MAEEPTTTSTLDAPSAGPEPAVVDPPPSVDASENAPPKAPARRRRRSAAPAGEPVIEAMPDIPEAPRITEAADETAPEQPTLIDPEPIDPEPIEPEPIEPEPIDAAPADPAGGPSDERRPDAAAAPIASTLFLTPAATALFQAPEAAAPRRRRATAAAGPAQPAMFSPPDVAEREPVARARRRSTAPPDEAATPAVDPKLVEGLLDDLEDLDAPAAPDGESVTTARRSPRRRRRAGAAAELSFDDSLESIDVSGRVATPPEIDLEDVEDPEDPEDAPEDLDADDVDGDEETDDGAGGRPRRRRRGGRGRKRRRTEGEEPVDGEEPADVEDEESDDDSDEDTESDDGDDADEAGSSRSARRRRRRRRRGGEEDLTPAVDDPPGTVVKVRDARSVAGDVTSIRGSTRLEAKRQRRREGRDSMRRRTIITEAEFLARRESVDRTLLVRDTGDRTQIAVLEDGVLVEHYVTRAAHQSMIGNVHLGKVQNVLPSMEAAFVDIGRGRNAVLYAGEVNWDSFGLEGKADRRIESALKPGDTVLVQVTKDPIGHKGARLTSQVSLPGRFVVFVPGSSMTGISRKLPDVERNRLKKVLKRVLPEDSGVIVRTAAEGAAEEDLERDVARLTAQWADIERKAKSVASPALLYSEPDLAIRVVRDAFNEDFTSLVVSGDDLWDTLAAYVGHVAPDLAPRMSRWQPEPGTEADLFVAHRLDEQIAKGLDRKVWLPSGGSLIIDRTEAMSVVDVNTGKYTGSGGDLEETVTKNNLEAAEEIVRQLRLRDIGGIIVVDFIDMVLESNRQLVLRRLVECLGRDRTKHQVAEVTSLGLVQMTRKKVGQGLLEAFSTTCETCHGRGLIVGDHPVDSGEDDANDHRSSRGCLLYTSPSPRD